MNSEDSPLWKFIPLQEYSRPAAPTGESVRRGVSYLWERLRNFRAKENSSEAQKELHPLSPSLLDKIVPAPVWDDAATALKDVLKPWLESPDAENNVQVLVGPPGSGMSEISDRWSRLENCNVVKAPTSDDILAGGKDWLAQLDDSEETPLVFTRLEDFYLRHYNGMTLLGRLLDWLWSSNRPCLVDCDSWSWAFLSKVLQIDSAFPKPLTLEAFDHNRLQDWFRKMACGVERDLAFRRADDGTLVMALDAASNESEETADFLNHIAAHSRGIPGVARELWRHSLRDSPDESMNGENSRDTIWVSPWQQLTLPDISGGVGQNDLFVLQELLLDGDMSAQLLSKLLPISFAETTHSLKRLQMAGLLESNEGIWRVTLLGYPAIRQYLSGAGYLVDSF